MVAFSGKAQGVSTGPASEYDVGVLFTREVRHNRPRALAQTYFLELQNPTRISPQVSAIFAWGASLGVIWYLR